MKLHKITETVEIDKDDCFSMNNSSKESEHFLIDFNGSFVFRLFYLSSEIYSHKTVSKYDLIGCIDSISEGYSDEKKKR